MTVRFPDLQVLVPRSAEITKVQAVRNEHYQVQQQTIALKQQELNERQLRQVNQRIIKDLPNRQEKRRREEKDNPRRGKQEAPTYGSRHQSLGRQVDIQA